MMPSVVTWPPIHSIVVVTSPMGDQAPPAFAASTTIPAKNQRVSLSAMSLRNKLTMTMAVVRLSSTEDRKKVMKETIHSN